MTKIKTAVFPVAGLGTRFLPITKVIAKEMLVVVDKPLIQYAVEEAKQAGIEKFIFVSSRGKNSIEDHFDAAPVLEDALKERKKFRDLQKVIDSQLDSGQAVFIRQHSPKGLGHAVHCAHSLVNEEAFAVILADDLVLAPQGCLKQMVDAYEPSDGNMIAVETIPPSETFRYGIFDVASQVGKKITARSIVEKPAPDVAPSTTAVIGRYILKTAIFDHLKNAAAGLGNEIQLTDAIQNMIHDTPLTGFGYDGKRYDCGMKIGWLEANIAYFLKDADAQEETKLMLQRMVKELG